MASLLFTYTRAHYDYFLCKFSTPRSTFLSLIVVLSIFIQGRSSGCAKSCCRSWPRRGIAPRPRPPPPPPPPRHGRWRSRRPRMSSSGAGSATWCPGNYLTAPIPPVQSAPRARHPQAGPVRPHGLAPQAGGPAVPPPGGPAPQLCRLQVDDCTLTGV